ncbi:galactose ABC transporter substrate-binding protein [Anaerolineaceae bacterium oral taxon 439]|nr:galactose ABC transporter substrate-binding protein [Anaerolineaceae bacterium oral taxon 439]
MKRSLFFVAAFAVLIGMAAAPVHADKDINATVIWRAFDDQFQSGFRIIMEHEAEKIDGITLEMQDGENDVSKTTNKLEAALTKGADAIAVCAPDRLCTAELMKKADAENVPVVFFNMEPMAETMEAYDSIWYVGAQAKESGVMCAQALINYWNENKGIADKNGDNILQLVILQGEIGQQDVILRTEAYEETLTEQGIDYEIIAIDTANWDKAQALDKMNAWITAFGIDGVEGVLANNDSMAMGAVQAALNNGYNKGDPNKFIPIVGIDATIEALQAMKAGSLLGTVLNDRTSQSIAVVNILKAIGNGETIIDAETVGVSSKIEGNYIWIPYEIVNQDNLEETLELMLEFN